MTAGDEPPPVLPSALDDEYECVLVDPEAARAPPGYVPRLKGRAPYRLRGKEVVSEDPPEQNPDPPPTG